MNEDGVWIFTAGYLPAAAFTELTLAEEWISTNKLTGMLSLYPLNVSVFDWVVDQGDWKPRDPSQRTPEFLAKFTSARLRHLHYEDGERVAGD